MKFDAFFSSPSYVFTAAVVLRVVLLLYGHYQDQNSALKYTDIDYYVFTDAARYIAQDASPYTRDTYRYTPLLAWMLQVTAWPGLWFDFGKLLFAMSDVGAGYFIYLTLISNYSMSRSRALKFSSIWLLNPMVAQISTRGSSEGVVALFVTALLWAILDQRFVLGGVLLGAAVHLKIYPFIYAASIIWHLGSEKSETGQLSPDRGILHHVYRFVTPARVQVTCASGVSFLSLNLWMYLIYGWPFLEHTFLYHLVRSDHRHNFSVYNALLHLKASPASSGDTHPEALAFLPQLALCVIAIPLTLAKTDLPSALFAQTFAFVAFNKVCTSQYFLWYMVFLPFYLPRSMMLRERNGTGWTVLALWIVGQGLWLQQGYQLEFLGKSSFLGLCGASTVFFLVNIWILGLVIKDVRTLAPSSSKHLKIT